MIEGSGLPVRVEAATVPAPRHPRQTQPVKKDPRVARFQEIGSELRRMAAATEKLRRERVKLLTELRGTGQTMDDLATTLGISRARLYQLLGDIPEGDRRKKAKT